MIAAVKKIILKVKHFLKPEPWNHIMKVGLASLVWLTLTLI